MVFKREFESRLQYLADVLDLVLMRNKHGACEYYADLFPALYSVFAYLWSHTDKDSAIFNLNSPKCSKLPNGLKYHNFLKSR